MATTMVLRENVLTDDILRVADKGKCFGRRDYKVQVVYYTYANAWGDHEHFFHAKTVESALKRYERIKGKITVQASGENAARIKANDAMLNMSDMALAEKLLNNRNLDGTEVED